MVKNCAKILARRKITDGALQEDIALFEFRDERGLGVEEELVSLLGRGFVEVVPADGLGEGFWEGGD